MKLSRRLFLGIIFTILLSGGLFFASATYAQLNTSDVGLEYAANIGLGTRDIRDTIVSIIQIFLGFLGLVALVIILYGGFLYMTSAGDATKIEKAKKLMINAGIGLVIIFSAYAITAFVFRFLTAGQIGPTSPVRECVPTEANNFCLPRGSSPFTPTYDCPDPDSSSPAPFICKVTGTPNSPGGYVRIKGGKFGSAASLGKVYFVAKELGVNEANGQISTDVFATCGGTNTKCLPAEVLVCGGTSSWLDYSVKVIVPNLDTISTEYYIYVEKRVLKTGTTDQFDTYYSAVKDALDESQGGFNAAILTNKFTLTTEVVPSLGCITPERGPNGTEVTISGTNLGANQPANSSLVFFDRQTASGFDLISWVDNQIVAKVPTDASNRRSQSPIYVKYQNTAQQDAYSSTVDFAITCGPDNSCGTGSLCINGLCELQQLPEGAKCGSVVDNACRPELTCAFGLACDLTANPSSSNGAACGACAPVPTITGISPADGAVGTFVTIYGLNLGNTVGKVFFKGATTNRIEATAPAACVAAGAWTDNQIIVEVPVGAATGIVTVETAGGRTATTADLETNSVFTVNSLVRPGLCVAYKEGTKITTAEGTTYVTSATFNETVVYEGQNFSVDATSPQLNGRELTSATASSTTATGVVPNLVPKFYRAQVEVNDVFSNSVNFTVSPAPKIPSISYLDVTSGPEGQYVSIYGSNFGRYRGSAQLSFLPNGAIQAITSSATDLFNFPDVCADTNFWTDTNIVFKVPLGVALGNAKVQVRNEESLVSTEEVFFDVCEVTIGATSDCPLSPGVCQVEPNQGPAGLSNVKLYGEGFGSFLACPETLVAGSVCSGVNFFNNQFVTNLDATAWSPSQVGSILPDGQIVVPDDAQTGPVQLLTRNGASNSLNFTVADCRTDESICTDAATTCCQLDGVCQMESECQPVQAPLSNLNYRFLTGSGRALPGLPVVRENRMCTNMIQSPSPYLDMQGVCVNAQVSASFVDARNAPVQMEVSAFNADNIKVFKCGTTATFDVDADFTPVNCPTEVAVATENQVTGTETVITGYSQGSCISKYWFFGWRCRQYAQIPIYSTVPTYAQVDAITPLDNNSGFIWKPEDNYELNTWYVVQLTSGSNGIRSVNGLALDGDRNGVPGNNYEWAFRVGNDPTECQVGKVDVLPNQATTTLIGEMVDYQATAMAQNCNLLDANDFDWSWQSSKDPKTFSDASVIASILSDFSTDQVYKKDWRQQAISNNQGVAYIGATPYSQTNGEPLAFKDLNNRLVVDFKIPEIYTVFHNDGLSHPNINNYVRITGKNFGVRKESASNVLFGETAANLAQCAVPWSDNQLVVRQPVAQQVVNDGNRILLDEKQILKTFTDYAKENAVLAYDFNGETGPTVKDLVDQGTANDGTFSDNVSRTASPLEGRAAQFAQPSVAVAAAPFPPFLKIPASSFAAATAGSVELWFRADLSSGETTLGERVLLSLKNDLNIRIDASGILRIGTLSSDPGQIEAGNLYHVAYVDDGTSSRLYLNGILTHTTGTQGFISDNNVQFVYVGGNESSNSAHFNGLIDNLAIYAKAIPQSQVMANAGINPDAQGLVGLIDFEGEGVIYTDSSSNNLSLMSDNNPDRTTEGYFGQGANFNLNIDPSAPESTQYLKINPAKEMAFSQAITVSAWINPFTRNADGTRASALDGPHSIISSDVDGGFALIIGDDNTVRFRLRSSNGDFIYAQADKDLLQGNQWNFIAGTYDGQTIRIYINGTEAGSFNTDLPYVSKYTNLPVCLGARLTKVGEEFVCSGDYFSGTMDQVAIYNRTLSATEISSLYGMAVPEGQAGVPISVRTARGEGFADELFTKSENIYPYICQVNPNQGPAGTTVNLTGENFSNSNLTNGEPNGNTVLFDMSDLSIMNPVRSFITLWNGLTKTITLTNPFANHNSAKMDVKVRLAPTQTANLTTTESNSEPYWFRPVIQSVSPNQGPRGQWITISGYNFGPYKDEADNVLYDQDDIEGGGVYFTGASGIVKAQLAACGDGAWTNNSVTIEVPSDAVTGAIFLRSTFSHGGNPPLRLDSDPANFTVTEAPVGPGLCPIVPKNLRGGMNAELTGIRFGDDQGTAPAATTILINQTIPFAAGAVPDLDWNDQQISLTTAANIATGLVQVIRRVQTGEVCAGLSFGNFCPGGRYEPVIVDAPSNAQPIYVLSGATCDGGYPGQAEAVEAGWPKNIFYRQADNTEVDVPVELGNLTSDGTYIYARAWLNGELTNKPGFVAKIGTGRPDSVSGIVTEAGRLYNWYVDSSITTLDGDELDQATNFFMLNGKLSYVIQDSDGSLIRRLTLSATSQTVTSPVELDPEFLALGRQFNYDDLPVANPFLSYPSSAGIGEERFIVTSAIDTKGKLRVLNLGATGDGYILRIYDPSDDWSIVSQTVISAPESRPLAVSGIVASDQYLYLIGWQGESDIIDWRGTAPALTPSFQERYQTDNINTREVSGFYDQGTKEIYLGELANQSAAYEPYASALPNDLLYRYDRCGVSSSNFCTEDIDCKTSIANGVAVDCAESVCNPATNLCSPVIREITPSTSPIGSWVTIKGCQLGENGIVNFNGNDTIDIDTDLATNPPLYNKQGLPLPNYCADTYQQNHIVVEVPNINTSGTGDDAVSGPIQLVRNNGSTETIVDTGSAAEADRDMLWYTEGGILRPEVCNLIPASGDIGEGTEIRGRRFGEPAGTSFATFVGNEIDLADDRRVSNLYECPSPAIAQEQLIAGSDPETFAPWSDKRICAIVPSQAATGSVEVTTDAVSSQNKIPYTVFTRQFGPQLVSSIAADQSEGICRNSVATLVFDQALFEESIEDSVSMYLCQDRVSSAGRQTLVRSLWTSVRRLFGVAIEAQDETKACNRTAQPLAVETSYELIQGVSRVQITPSAPLEPGARYQIEIDNTLKGINGISFNRSISSAPGSVEENVLPLQQSLVTFDTLGTFRDYDSGICAFGDVQVSVFAQRDEDGEIRSNDNFFCSGDNCDLDFDFDQLPGTPGNQHKYVAHATNENITNQQTVSDNFDRGIASEGDNIYETTLECTISTSSNKLTAISVGQTCQIVHSDSKNYNDRVTASVNLMAASEDANFSYGLAVGGILAYREIANSNNYYVLEYDGKKSRSAAVPNFNTPSRLEVVFDGGVGTTLKVNGESQLTVAATFNPSLGVGLFTKNTSLLTPLWDNLRISTLDYNFLKAAYSWERSEALDPLRLVNLFNPLDTEISDVDKVANDTGEVFTDINPVAQGNTKIAIRVGSGDGLRNNVVVKPFPINVFICQNPWISHNFRFVDSVFNFISTYCRDAGDIKDLSDDLPSAGVIDTNAVQARQDAISRINNLQQQVNLLEVQDPINATDLNSTISLYQAVLNSVNALSDGDSQKQPLIDQLTAINAQIIAVQDALAAQNLQLANDLVGAVESAATTLTSQALVDVAIAAYNSAKDAVDALPAGSEKDALTARLEAVKTMIDNADFTPPPAPSVPDLAAADDSGISNSDNITNITSALTFTGTAEAGSTVELFNGASSVGSTAVAGGDWSIDTSLAVGTHSLTARATDGAGNVGPNSAALTVTIDTAGPTVAINQAGDQVDPTGTSPINFSVVFSESVADFAAADVSITGTAGGTLAASVTGTGTSYNIAVSGMSDSGTVIVSIPDGRATDAAGNVNSASTSTDDTVTFSTFALSFNGTDSHAIVNVPAAADLTTGVVTIEFWTTCQYTSLNGLLSYFYNSSIWPRIYMSGCGAVKYQPRGVGYGNTQALTEGTRSLFATIIDYNNSSITFCANQSCTSSTVNAGDLRWGNEFLLGAMYQNTSTPTIQSTAYYSGTIDNLRIYKGSMSSANISEHFNGNYGSTTATLWANFSFNQSSADLSGQGSTITLNNTTYVPR